jgi:ubiquinone/menaquinone biosynthesis C-methylase UbiE
VAQLAFDEATGKRLEALYRISDAVRRRRLVRGALAAAPGERILDVGCGPGFYCAELLEEVGPQGSIVGLDSSPHMLELAARRCEGLGNVEFKQADATSLPVEDHSVDRAICVQVLEYVPDAAAALAEFHRALRPGGRVVIWDIDWATVSWHSADPTRMARVLEAWDEHLVHRSLPSTLAPVMRSAGFERVQMQAHCFASADFDTETFATSMIPMVANFVAGRNGVGEDEAKAWAAEQRDLGERGEFYFAGTQFCFTAARPA